MSVLEDAWTTEITIIVSNDIISELYIHFRRKNLGCIEHLCLGAPLVEAMI